MAKPDGLEAKHPHACGTVRAARWAARSMANEQQRASGTERPIEADITLTIVPAIIAAADALLAELEVVNKSWLQGRRSRRRRLTGTARSRRR
ncbi:hypothetical protein [Bradyrhizobium tunisiense]|uniref:hypothetical protein n=1 Tax=Bradyrhizobium tunisiense TaxID=3278709 RepID=UPI0035D8C9EB